MVDIRVTLHLQDDLYDKLKDDLENGIGRCAEMSFIFLKIFNRVSDTNPDVIRDAVNILDRIEEARLRSFLESHVE